MTIQMEACPHCGREIMKHAMRCPGCGKVLKTAKEQDASYRRLKESQKSSGLGKIIKFIVIVGVIAAVAYNFQDEILELVEGFLKK